MNTKYSYLSGMASLLVGAIAPALTCQFAPALTCQFASHTYAQIIPDGTLSTSVTSPDNQNFTIENGDRAGNNLFHSFADFSIPTNGSAVFNNATTFENIFSRITGNNISNIDGLIQANGTANLFLLNPNGIIFGPNARLDLGGSFLGSTADTLLFDNNIVFSTTDTPPSPLLSVNVPVGLQWNQVTPAPIVLQGNSVNLPMGKTLTLLGGDLTLSDSTLTTFGGQITLGSLGTAGTLQLTEDPSVRFPDGLARGEILLGEASFVSAESGSIDVIANTLNLTGGSRLQTVTNSPSAGGDITVNASGAITISGLSDEGLFSGILSHSATDISGTGGNITINSPQNTLTLSNRSFLGTVTNSQNAGGNVEVNVNRVHLMTGGQIFTVATNRGNAGTIILNAKEQINISGESDDLTSSSPFLDRATFDLNRLDFSTETNSSVAESGPGGIPYVSVERTPFQIVSGTSFFGPATDQVDYYSFGVVEGSSQVIFDIDFTLGISDELNTEIFLFNQLTGELIAQNDDSFVSDGAEGSFSVLPRERGGSDFARELTRDSFIDVTLSDPGFYVLGVAANSVTGVNQSVIDANGVQVGQGYTLQASIQNQGTDGLILPVSNNPNIGRGSGVFSEASGRGNGGPLIINTGQLTVSNDGRLSTITSGFGRGGNLMLNVDDSAEFTGAEVWSVSDGRGDGGDILIQMGQLRLIGSDILSQTFAFGNAGDIRLRARESIELNTVSGTADTFVNRSRIDNSTEFQAFGASGEIEIETSVLNLQNRAFIGTANRTIATGTSNTVTGSGIGDINITAFEAITLASDSNLGSFSLFEGLTGGGDITINTKQLRVLDGIISLLSLGKNDSNRLMITARDSVDVIGDRSYVIAGPQRGSTSSAELILRTEDLRIADGATVGASPDLTQENGEAENSGTITIEATSINLSNQASLLSAPFFPAASGNAGGLNITATEDISVVGDSQISVSSLIEGRNAGDLTISANCLLLDQGGLISAESSGGEQGNINLMLNEFLLLRRGGSITTNAIEASTGGNIEITVPFIIAIPNENSDIVANAVQGSGGNIQITATDIFGIQFRSHVTPLSDITASSQFGVNGLVQIQTSDLSPSQGTVKLPSDLTDASNQISTECLVAADSSFVITGRGGLPDNPRNLDSSRVWEDLRPLETYDRVNSATISTAGSYTPLIEATEMHIATNGQVEFVAQSETLMSPSQMSCGGRS